MGQQAEPTHPNVQQAVVVPEPAQALRRFVRQAQQAIVAEDFYSNPHEVRELLLAHPEWFTVRGNFPGLRTDPMVTASTRQHLLALLGADGFSYWPTASCNGAFQFTTRHLTSWIHADETEWAGVLFLTPDAPASSGTCFYRHLATGLRESPTAADAARLGFATAEALRDFIYRDATDYSKWEKVDELGNVFNRLVLYKGRRFHVSAPYFGESLADGRLFQTFFFNL